LRRHDAAPRCARCSPPDASQRRRAFQPVRIAAAAIFHCSPAIAEPPRHFEIIFDDCPYFAALRFRRFSYARWRHYCCHYCFSPIFIIFADADFTLLAAAMLPLTMPPAAAAIFADYYPPMRYADYLPPYFAATPLRCLRPLHYAFFSPTPPIAIFGFLHIFAIAFSCRDAMPPLLFSAAFQPFAYDDCRFAATG
jgi:hypothetical protein